MNVLFLTRYDVREFGVAEVIRGLAAALGARGVRVVVASSHPSTEGVHIAEADACHHLPLPHPRLLDAPSSVRSLSELCQRHRIDLVHCHGLYRPGHAARLLRKATGIPYIVTSHNIMPAKRARRWRVRHRCRRILKDAAAVTCFNRVMARDIHGFLDTRGKTWIIPNGLDLAQWSDSTAPADVPVVLGIGRVVWDKGFDMLVEAAAHLRDAPAPPAWVIAGEGEMKPELEARARQLGLNVCATLPPDEWQGGTLYLPGMVRGATKRRLFQASSIVAFPTRPEFGESFGMVLLEAMAAGRAVVASDLPIVRELIEDERNGRLVPPRDAAAWAQAIRALLADPAQRQRMQQQNLADARQYDWSSVAERMHEVYETVTNRSRAGLNQG